MVIVVAIFIFVKEFANNNTDEVLSGSDIETDTYANEDENIDKDTSFYQKLSYGADVSVLIIGDSIGAGNGASSSSSSWASLLDEYLQEQYGCNVQVTNVSMGGNSTYSGYVRTMLLDDGVNYDLAIICYGQNDALDSFAVRYEALICAIEGKYSDCSIISVLESSQKEYTEKMQIIQSICGHYGIPMADTIAAFNNSGILYDELAGDGTHPNDTGYAIYFETVKSVIDENVAVLTGKMPAVDVIDNDVHKYDNFIWYDAINDIERVDDYTFIIDTAVSGMMSIYYKVFPGDNNISFYIDGELINSFEITWIYSFEMYGIAIIEDDCSVTNEIKIVFGSKELADSFKGLCFNWE